MDAALHLQRTPNQGLPAECSIRGSECLVSKALEHQIICLRVTKAKPGFKWLIWISGTLLF